MLWAMQAIENDAWIAGCNPANPSENCPSQIGPDHDRRSFAIFVDAHHAVTAYSPSHLETRGFQLFGKPPRSILLPSRQFGVGVKMPVQVKKALIFSISGSKNLFSITDR